MATEGIEYQILTGVLGFGVRMEEDKGKKAGEAMPSSRKKKSGPAALETLRGHGQSEVVR